MMSQKYQCMSDCPQAYYSGDRIENTIRGKNMAQVSQESCYTGCVRDNGAT